MKLLTLLLPFYLWATPHYPFLFSSVSDKIYKHLDGYKQLLTIEYFTTHCLELSEYIEELELLKKEGFRLEMDLSSPLKNSYAKSLRNQEEKLREIDEKISRELAELFKNREFTILILLQESSLNFVRNSYEVSFAKEAYASPQKQNEAMESQISLESSLTILKDKLVKSRDLNSSLSACLNDIASINYFMIAVDKERLKSRPCKALKYIENLQEYDRSSQLSCKDEISYYDKWQTKSEAYRTTLLLELRNSCGLSSPEPLSDGYSRNISLEDDSGI